MNMIYAPTSPAIKLSSSLRPRLDSAIQSVQHAIRSPLQTFKNLSPVMRQRIATLVLLALLGMMIAAPHAITHAQSFAIDFSSDDLEPFFEWFNTMFGILLPIALIGAGIVAGGMFVWVVAGMLQRAFTSMLGGLRTR